MATKSEINERATMVHGTIPSFTSKTTSLFTETTEKQHHNGALVYSFLWGCEIEVYNGTDCDREIVFVLANSVRDVRMAIARSDLCTGSMSRPYPITSEDAVGIMVICGNELISLLSIGRMLGQFVGHGDGFIVASSTWNRSELECDEDNYYARWDAEHENY